MDLGSIESGASLLMAIGGALVLFFPQLSGAFKSLKPKRQPTSHEGISQEMDLLECCLLLSKRLDCPECKKAIRDVLVPQIVAGEATHEH